jgi:uncharacterized membrane protein YvlD (DUF360 family)
MTRYSSWAIRISLVYLVLGFTLGALLLASKVYVFYPPIYLYLSLHVEYLMFGWFLHLIFGTAYWMFPRFTPRKTDYEKSRGFVWAAWASLVVLNVGLVLYTLGSFLPWSETLRVAGRVVETGAVVLFLINLWPRVKPVSEPS